MSGIFKGDSIYKSGGGGGGGGYKDGGALVDGDYIKVENNTVSSYDNVSRDPVNFYFEVKDGEILNSVVELTTAVNATINVYVVNNGLFIPLGNVGGDTVTAGNEYNLNIVGNSFILEAVTQPIDTGEITVIYENEIYQMKKFGTTYWLKNDLHSVIPGVRYITDSVTTYYNVEDLYNKYKNIPNTTYTLPNFYDECQELYAQNGGGNAAGAALKADDPNLWNPNYGTNTSGLGFGGCGWIRNGTKDLFKTQAHYAMIKNAGCYSIQLYADQSKVSDGNPGNTAYIPVRLIIRI